MTIGGWCIMVISGDGPTMLLAIAIASVSDSARSQPSSCRNVRVLGAGDDDPPDVLAPVLAPVPHEERVRAVVGVPAPVHLHVARVVRELFLVLVPQLHRVARLGQQPVEELDVARVVVGVELVVARVA